MQLNQNKIHITQISPPYTIYPMDRDEILTILWNTGDENVIRVDDLELEVKKHCIMFISEFYMSVTISTDSFRMVEFTKSFLSPDPTLKNVGEYLMLFYGQHSIDHIPKITLNIDESIVFEKTWSEMQSEYHNIENPISEALLLNSFQRLLLYSQKVHMETEFDIPMEFNDLRLVREFQYLVNIHFKDFTKVSEYAEILKISPKKISELFSCCYDKKASELIANRRNLYARRQLIHSNELIKNIAYELNFSDSQSFSHFFKKQNGVAPEEFRTKVKQAKGPDNSTGL